MGGVFDTVLGGVSLKVMGTNSLSVFCIYEPYGSKPTNHYIPKLEIWATFESYITYVARWTTEYIQIIITSTQEVASSK